MHIQEFAENSVDFAHFEPLHGNMMIPWTPYSIPGIKIKHTAAWVLGTESEGKHIAHFKDHAVLKIFGRTLPRTEANADITFVGTPAALFCVPLSWVPASLWFAQRRPRWCGVLSFHDPGRGRHFDVPNPHPTDPHVAGHAFHLVR
jgi:hypothetical protein